MTDEIIEKIKDDLETAAYVDRLSNMSEILLTKKLNKLIVLILLHL